MSFAILKKLGAVAAILAIAWLIYVYRQVPHDKTPFAKMADQADQIILEQGTRRLTFHRESGVWKVGTSTGPFYAADIEVVKPLISGMKNLQIEDEISERSDRAGDYDLTPELGYRVRLLNAQGGVLAEGIFGKQAPDYGHVYFRYPDKPEVYLARGVVRGDLGRLEQNIWRSRQLIDIPETKIENIVIEGKGFKSDLVRVSTDVWMLNGQPADPAPVNALIGILAHLKANEFIDPAVNPTLTYESLTEAYVGIKGADRSAEIRFGAPDAKSKRYPISVGKESGLAWLSEDVAKAILKRPSNFTLKK